jgi:hypothetical protein
MKFKEFKSCSCRQCKSGGNKRQKIRDHRRGRRLVKAAIRRGDFEATNSFIGCGYRD